MRIPGWLFVVGGLALYLALLVVGAVWIHGRSATGAGAAAPAHEAVIIAVNDVYRIEGVDNGWRGGIARLRALRESLERTHPDLLLLHAGDLLSPSLLSRTYYGEQMVDTLNMLDGVRGGTDGRMLVAFGNHEFDKSDCKSPGILRQRVMESEFTWLASNIDFSACHGAGAMLPPNEHLAQSKLIEVGGVRVGLFALLLPFSASESRRQPEIRPYLEVSHEMTKRLRQQGAQVVIALTHLPIKDDLALVNPAGKDNPDLVIGGHDHIRMAEPKPDPRVLKADADAVTATVVTITLDDGGNPVFAYRWETLDQRVAPDPAVLTTVQYWQQRHARELCAGRGRTDDCLDEIVGLAKTPIEAEEEKNRSQETGIGDWLADRMLDARSDADAAILNSGTLRLNYDLPAGSTIRQRQVEELFGYPVPLLVVQVPGAVLWRAVQNGLSKSGEGGWPHLGGVAVALREDRTLDRLLVLRRRDGAVVKIGADSTEPVRLVVSAFLACGGDGYDLGSYRARFPDDDACQKGVKDLADRDGPKVDLATEAVAAIRRAYTIAPVADGRLCQPKQSGCLIEAWSTAITP
jgi:2',3'-cyclic-nucleotide 2'-phosphodiesterase (5'-nucleotidase family)